MREDPRHVTTSPFTSYNFHGKGNFASMVDVVVLGATEVDLDFNANVVTHSDGRLLHGIGGWQNCLAAGCTILAVPSFRDRIPVIVDEVTTLCGPGELIDVVVTERGIAINPRRQDLLDAVAGLGSADPPDRGAQGRGRPDLRRPPQAAPLRPAGGGDQVGRRHGARHRLAGGRGVNHRGTEAQRSTECPHPPRGGRPRAMCEADFGLGREGALWISAVFEPLWYSPCQVGGERV